MKDCGYIIIRYDKTLSSLLAQKPETDRSNGTNQAQAFIREKASIWIQLFNNKQVSGDSKSLEYANLEDG